MRKRSDAELEQHAPRLGGDSAHRPTVALDRVGTPRAALVGRDVRAAHDEARLVVSDVELVAHHLPERRARALAAIGLADEERGRVVRMDQDPRVELAKVAVGIRARANRLRERAPAGNGADAQAEDQGSRRPQKARREVDGFSERSASSIAFGNSSSCSSDGSLGSIFDAGRGRAAHDAFDRRLDAVIRHAPT